MSERHNAETRPHYSASITTVKIAIDSTYAIISLMEVLILTEAEVAYRTLPIAERRAMRNAIAKLEEVTGTLGAPHTSAIKGSSGLRELRPRAGRSPWRAFYRQIGNQIVIAAFGPEAQVDARGFARSVGIAEERLAALG